MAATLQVGGGPSRSSASLLLPSLKWPASSSVEEEKDEESWETAADTPVDAVSCGTGEHFRRSGGVKSSKAWTAESSVLSRRVHHDDDDDEVEEEQEVVDA